LAFKAAYSIRTVLEKGLFAIFPEIASLSANGRSSDDLKGTIRSYIKSITNKIIYYVIPGLIILLITAPFWLKLWLGNDYSRNLLYSFWILQPGIIVGMIALPSFYSLMASDNEVYCLLESLIRSFILLMMTGIFVIFNMHVYYIYLFFTLSIVVSNLYIITKFIKTFNNKEYI
jgi:hypothetical protein